MHKLSQQTTYKAFWIDALLADDVPKSRSDQEGRKSPETSRSSEGADDSEQNPSSPANRTSTTSTGSPVRQPISEAMDVTDTPIDLCRHRSSSPPKNAQYENRYPLLGLPRPNLHSDLQRLLQGIEEARQYVVASRAFDCIEPLALPAEVPLILPVQSPRQRKSPSDTECSESELPNSCSGSEGNRQTFEGQGESRKKRARVSFSNEQVMELERRFYRQRYLSSAERSELARTLDLSETQV
ncbi:unnamed protein product [Dibothriocephalus latus]|uniref:Homeobox domain-containing protein n=1 Tax=Dibothriocephalus latus TaxID=60516 RepID=A0A3P7PE84_DIBLA|nr:unnamed protein product [Dibothriocephalus latus]